MKTNHIAEQCANSIATKHSNKKGILRRKFVPIQLTISRKNQCINAGTKLPFTTASIHGVLTTSNVNNPVSEVPTPLRYFYGISRSKIEDDRFLQLSEGIIYDSRYPPDVNATPPLNSDEDLWWYFVHPATDVLPSFKSLRVTRSLSDYQELSLLFEGQSNADRYFLWSEPFFGSGVLTFEQSSILKK